MSAGKLPEGWATAPVSTVTTLIRGVTYKKEQAINYLQDDYLPLIRANNIQNGKFDTTDLVFVPKNLVKESQKISPEDIVIAMSSGSKSVVGKSAHQRLPFECSFGAFCGALRPEKRISPSFIAHFTKSFFYRNKISSLSAGANINNIKPASFDLINIPIPSLSEQKIIAEKLDTLLPQVDSTKARLEKIPQILKRFRQAILTAAVNGLLTEAWRNKVQEPLNFKKINFESILTELRNGLSSKPNEKGLGYPILRISSVRSGHVVQSDIRYLECSEAELERHRLEEGDLLFTRYNGSLEFVGVCGLLKKTQYKDLLYPDKLIRARLTKDALPKYIEIFFSSPGARNAMMECVKTTSGQKGISGKDIKSQLVYLPSLKEQHEIVRRVEQLFACADTIEKQVNSALTRVNSLTQSILAKAFRGELTAQWRAENPDLISGENSAAALLEKIKAERAASGGKKASRKKA
ncbi:type I restriction-modification system specificity subunit [Klebsiella spallanzanii]|uniref:type I restriction-modification system specificity subunit n=1 Tax=Klebsiella spallanzanii TaxID=2587528 RepID=UPI001158884F|nr:type I restriction-modification system specificity subunit [Klebsiella spallanzanii]VUS72830.1 Type-1 restriction enzyme EcoKI specificity protein [Klebsiella spallanzanii]